MHQASPQVLKEGAHLAGVPTPRMSLKFTAPGVNKTCLALNELMLLVSQSQNYPHFKSKCTQAFSHSIFYPCGRGMSQNGQRTGVRLLATWKSGAGRHSPGLDLPLSLALVSSQSRQPEPGPGRRGYCRTRAWGREDDEIELASEPRERLLFRGRQARGQEVGLSFVSGIQGSGEL